VAIDTWKWTARWAGLLMGIFLFVDLAFFTANLPKVPRGGWFPLLLATGVFSIMWTWRRGREALQYRLQAESMSLGSFLAQISEQSPLRTPGTAIYLNSRHLSLPFALLKNYEHNRVIHERVVLMTILFQDIPYVAEKDRLMVENLEQSFFRVTARYGFKQNPNVPRALAMCARVGLSIDLDESTFFLGRETLIPRRRAKWRGWQEILFISLFRNAASPIQFFRLPPHRVLELGTVVAV
jgi:KUP system potassium uptake protein